MTRIISSALAVACLSSITGLAADEVCPLTGQPICSSVTITGEVAHGAAHAIPTTAMISTQPADERPAMDGYCPVCIMEMGKWEMGSPEHEAVYDGQSYRFPTAGVMTKFQANPAKYVPALGGDCTVCLAKGGKRMPGSLKHAAIYQGRMYLFPSEREKQMFRQTPQEFANIDLAMNGDCAVCQVMAGKQVAGRPEFSEYHNGMRYLFPSVKEQQMFRESPGKYLTKSDAGSGFQDVAPPMPPAEISQRGQPTEGRSVPTTNPVQQVSFRGTSACAACSYGVHPLQDPDQLGLAIKTSDGQIIVVEGAHQSAPGTYRDRFSSLNLEVTGTVIKSQGNVTWVQPSRLARR